MVAKIATDQKAEIDSHDTRVEEYMHRVNSSYEEVTFVRWLVSQIQFRGLQDDDETLAAQIWPELKSILGAEGVYYIKCHQTVQQTPSELCVPRIALAEGPLRLANELLADPTSAEKLLVWEYPQVHNSDQRPHGDGESAEVWSYIIVPVVNEAIQLGWILAVNKTVDSYFERSAHVDEFQPSEVEFGTYEATFMEAVATLLVTHAHNYSLFRAQEKLLLNTIRTLVNAVDARDPYTRGHSERVALTSRRLAEQLGLSTKECEEIYVAGLLHDIGKIGVPDRVLSKPGHLTDEEFELIKQHPTIGCQILRGLGEFAYVLPGVRYHHEAWDGSGYPDGLAGDAIPFIARIIAVADSYDAMTSNRPYRNGMPIEKAERILRENVGVQWDEKVVEAYFQIREDIHAIVDSSTSE
ncbi:HD-GYP domain-containing protein [Thalassoroseus pseudoceratinae]|uniref:HD-GYP domain-containing protein n=1 Tax=Thalassoroseus pseudoceratinae TaxID=2713176 RepID=UPI0019814A59|nr:HD-GYP domain-containing protein [Thalassoroseus pseudoceratinae]